jgi:hypothetical protein
MVLQSEQPLPIMMEVRLMGVAPAAMSLMFISYTYDA